jgi:hypothetical protein
MVETIGILTFQPHIQLVSAGTVYDGVKAAESVEQGIIIIVIRFINSNNSVGKKEPGYF